MEFQVLSFALSMSLEQIAHDLLMRLQRPGNVMALLPRLSVSDAQVSFNAVLASAFVGAFDPVVGSAPEMHEG